jgi:hypothetical protein
MDNESVKESATTISFSLPLSMLNWLTDWRSANGMKQSEAIQKAIAELRRIESEKELVAA